MADQGRRGAYSNRRSVPSRPPGLPLPTNLREDAPEWVPGRPYIPRALPSPTSGASAGPSSSQSRLPAASDSEAPGSAYTPSHALPILPAYRPLPDPSTRDSADDLLFDLCLNGLSYTIWNWANKEHASDKDHMHILGRHAMALRLKVQVKSFSNRCKDRDPATREKILRSLGGIAAIIRTELLDSTKLTSRTRSTQYFRGFTEKLDDAVQDVQLWEPVLGKKASAGQVGEADDILLRLCRYAGGIVDGLELLDTAPQPPRSIWGQGSSASLG